MFKYKKEIDFFINDLLKHMLIFISLLIRALVCLNVQFLVWYWVHFVFKKSMLKIDFVGGTNVRVRI
jgi:hypothetical protein